MASLTKMIKDSIATNTLIIGGESVVDNLKSGSLAKVVLAANAAVSVREQVERLARLSKVEIVVAKEQNNELGTLCKKPFSISALGFLKV